MFDKGNYNVSNRGCLFVFLFYKIGFKINFFATLKKKISVPAYQ